MREAKQEILEKIQRSERQIADQREKHRLFMERFFTTGDQNAKENADRILNLWHKYKTEIAELKEQLNKPE
jgi:hypothetical protein